MSRLSPPLIAHSLTRLAICSGQSHPGFCRRNRNHPGSGRRATTLTRSDHPTATGESAPSVTPTPKSPHANVWYGDAPVLQSPDDRYSNLYRALHDGRPVSGAAGACQFGHGLGGFAIKFIHSPDRRYDDTTTQARAAMRAAELPSCPWGLYRPASPKDRTQVAKPTRDRAGRGLVGFTSTGSNANKYARGFRDSPGNGTVFS